jgi:nucleotide-binding universal stress UspA family protein
MLADTDEGERSNPKEEPERGLKMNGFPEKILLATDGLENTALAARAAVDLAKKGGAELHVVHAWKTIPSPHFDGVIRSGLEDVGREVLEEQVRWIEDEGGTVAGAHLREGRAVEEIVEQAKESGAALLIVGGRGMGRLGRLVVGSVSTGLAHRSSCPVLLIVRRGEGVWPPERVLVGYGSFEDTEPAGVLGASRGKVLGAAVELVGVVDVESRNPEQDLRDLELALEARADEIEKVVGERPRVRALVGNVPETILGLYAEEEKPALLSFGSKVLGGAGRMMVGEALDEVLSESQGPILISPELHPASKAQALEREETEDPRGPTVLVATDGSEVSLRAGRYAARLAEGLGAKKLFALYVVDEHLTFRSGVHYGEFVRRLSEDGREATGKVRAMADEAGVECEELIVLGRPDRTIVAVAEEIGADPIVLGSEGTSPMEHALIGSVSEEVLRRANRTVLVVGGHPEYARPKGESSGVW